MGLWAMRYYMSIVYIVFIFICRRKANPACLRIIQILVFGSDRLHIMI